jgi:23S rRNA (cytidine1920-2'-O)/16S rRNA (cytidine1409-2'-O)-methyltransferase
MKTARVRLDELLVRRGLAETRSRAQALILAGLVYAGEQRLDKPGAQVAEALAISVRGRDHPWVSRGGVKLAHALDHFAIPVAGRICLDIGASTGGFTQVLLARGAARIFAVDVGHGQLAWALRTDPRVVVRERVNARRLSRDDVPEAPSLIVCDVSFISVTLVLPPAFALAAAEADLVVLIKPQFEAGRGEVGKGGVVRDAAVRQAVCERIVAWLGTQPGWQPESVIESPITGADGNVEYLLAARRRGVASGERRPVG